MSDNVISLISKRPVAADEADRQKAEAAYEHHLEQEKSKHQEELLFALDMLRDRVLAGQLDGLSFVGRNPNNGAFVSGTILNQSETKVDTFYSYAGALHALQLDVSDQANSGPHMNLDGSFFALGPVQALEAEDE